MRIVYLITGLGGGGAEKVVVDLADQMSKHGHQVKIVYLKGEIVVRPKSKNIQLIGLGLDNITQILVAYRNYKKFLKRFHPDVVHAHMVHANIFARVSRKFVPIPKLICTAHSNNEGDKLRMFAYRLTHNLADLTTNVSQSACKSFEQLGAVPEGKIQNIYNGIDLNKFQKSAPSDQLKTSILGANIYNKVLLAVGRLNKAKDYPNLIHAFKLILDQHHSTLQPILIIAGDGEEKFAIENLIQTLKLEKNIKLLGRRDDINKLMAIADIFVLSSSFEGFGLVVAEAMACNTFVVGTDCGGVKEVMGDTGILVPPRNSVALAEALMKVINMSKDEVIQNNMKALEHVNKNFDLQIIVEKWLELYAS